MWGNCHCYRCPDASADDLKTQALARNLDFGGHDEGFHRYRFRLARSHDPASRRGDDGQQSVDAAASRYPRRDSP